MAPSLVLGTDLDPEQNRGLFVRVPRAGKCAAGPGKNIVLVVVEEALTRNTSAVHVRRGLSPAAARPTGPDAVDSSKMADVRSGEATGEPLGDVVLVVAQGGTSSPVASEADASSWLDQEGVVGHAVESAPERVHLEAIAPAELCDASRPLDEFCR